MDSKRKLYDKIAENNLIKQGQLSDIKVSLAIDSEYWLKRYVESDPYTKLIGGLPLCLKSSTSAFIEALREYNLTPIFVFPGISVSFRENSNLDRKCQSRAKIWKLFTDSNLESFESELRKGQTLAWEAYSEWSQFIRSLDGQVLRAPYLQGSQLAYFQKDSLSGGIFGGLDLLIYGPESLEVIIDVDFAAGVFSYVEKGEVLRVLELSNEQLIDYFARTGYLFGWNIDRSDSLKVSDQALRREEAKYVENVRNLVQSEVVISVHGKDLFHLNVRPVQQFLGLRFPKKLYFAMCVFPLSAQLFTTIASHKLVELPPYAYSDFYRYTLSKLKPIRDTIFSIIYSSISRKYADRPVEIVYWFKKDEKENINVSRVVSTPVMFSDPQISEEKNRQGISVGLKFCLQWHLDSYKGPRQEHEGVLSSADMIKAQVIFRFLQYKEYIQDDKPTLFGLSLARSDEEMEEPLFYVLELFRFGLLMDKPLSQKNSNFLSAEIYGELTSSEKPEHILLISRVFSLIEPELKAEPWKGELDYDLIQFHYIVRLISTNCQSLCEAILVSEFLRGKIPFHSDVFKAVDSLPFRCHPNIALGIAIKLLLTGVSLEEISLRVPQIANLQHDLLRGWKFWVLVLRTVRFFEKKQAVSYTYLDVFDKASRFLQATLRRNGLNLVNR